MRLLTHNFLMCNRRKCQGGFPLKIVLNERPLVEEDADCNLNFVKSILDRIDWKSLHETAKLLDIGSELPASYTLEDREDDNFLKAVYRILLKVQIKEGALLCQTCGREYPISNGIPNMLLENDEA